MPAASPEYNWLLLTNSGVCDMSSCSRLIHCLSAMYDHRFRSALLWILARWNTGTSITHMPSTPSQLSIRFFSSSPLSRLGHRTCRLDCLWIICGLLRPAVDRKPRPPTIGTYTARTISVPRRRPSARLQVAFPSCTSCPASPVRLRATFCDCALFPWRCSCRLLLPRVESSRVIGGYPGMHTAPIATLQALIAS